MGACRVRDRPDTRSHLTAVTPLARRRASRSVHSLGTRRGKRRAGCIVLPWPASLSRSLRGYTLGVLPRACVRPLRARTRIASQAAAAAHLRLGHFVRGYFPHPHSRKGAALRITHRVCARGAISGHVTQRAVLRSGCATVRSRDGASRIDAPGSLAAKHVVVQNGRVRIRAHTRCAAPGSAAASRPWRCACAPSLACAAGCASRCARVAGRDFGHVLAARFPLRGSHLLPCQTKLLPEAANGRGLKANRAVGAADPKGPARDAGPRPHRSALEIKSDR